MLSALIDKLDNVELIRDQIASLLALEVANQKQLAEAALRDPNDWAIRIYSERAAPWDVGSDEHAAYTPVVNVWIDSITYDKSASNATERQHTEAVFNIDCIGFALSENIPGEGHQPGDQQAAFEAQRAVRLVRNILMAAENRYLKLRGLVSSRWPQSVSLYQPQLNQRAIPNVMGARLALTVSFNEFSPQVVPQSLEYLSMQVTLLDSGQVVIDADYDYTE